MSFSTTEIIFSSFPFLEQLDTQLKTDLLSQAQQLKLSTGEFICLEGDFCHHLPLVVSGNVRIYKIGESGREITLYHLEQGDSCIMTASCIFSNKAFPAFAIAESEVEAIIIPANSLKKWVMQSPVWQQYIFGLLSQRITNIIEIVEEVAFRRMDSRIASYLFKIRDIPTQSIQITHEEIAQELGTSREVVSRILKNFERKGLLSLSRGMIRLQDRDELGKIANLGNF